MEHIKAIAFVVVCWTIGILAGIGLLAIFALFMGWVLI